MSGYRGGIFKCPFYSIAPTKNGGVSPLCVWRWPTGKNEFSIGVIKAILAVTGLTFEEAFGEVHA